MRAGCTKCSPCHDKTNNATTCAQHYAQRIATTCAQHQSNNKAKQQRNAMHAMQYNATTTTQQQRINMQHNIREVFPLS
tara:strand:+ start:439 stop:675 length:237 start_codon:yes stop_codon:yes gene_type:complete